MGCNCNEKKYNISMGCCVPVLAPVENYYTKTEVDELIESAITSGSCCITPEEVDEKIASAKTEIEGEIPTVPTSNTAFTNDAGYITGVDLSNYATKDFVIDNVSAVLNDIGEVSDNVQTVSGDVRTISGSVNDVIETVDDIAEYIETVNSALTAHTADTSIHLTSGDVQNQISGKTDNTDFSAHTANTNIHLTQGEVSYMIYQDVSGKTDNSDFSAYTAATDAALSGKQDTLVSGTNIKTINHQSLLGSGNINIQGGTGDTCYVDDTEIVLNVNSTPYSDYRDSIYLCCSGTPSAYDINYYFYINNGSTRTNIYGKVNFSNGGHTGNTTSWDTYYAVTWDSANTRFLFSCFEGYKIQEFSSVGNGYYLSIPISTVSGTSCEAIEDIVDGINSLNDTFSNGINGFQVINVERKKLQFRTASLNGNTVVNSINLSDLKNNNGKLETDINVGLGTSGWTTFDTSTSNCSLNDINITKGRITYGSVITSYKNKDIELSIKFVYGSNNYITTYSPNIVWLNDSEYQIQGYIPENILTTSYDSATSALTVSVPSSAVTIGGNEGIVSIQTIRSNSCKFNDGITAEWYGELEEPIRQYVQENRQAINAKQDALTAGDGIDITNNVISTTTKFWCGTQLEYDQIQTKDPNTVYMIHE